MDEGQSDVFELFVEFVTKGMCTAQQRERGVAIQISTCPRERLGKAINQCRIEFPHSTLCSTKASLLYTSRRSSNSPLFRYITLQKKPFVEVENPVLPWDFPLLLKWKWSVIFTCSRFRCYREIVSDLQPSVRRTSSYSTHPIIMYPSFRADEYQYSRSAIIEPLFFIESLFHWNDWSSTDLQ